MSQYVESMLPSMGLTTDTTGNIVPKPEEAVGDVPAPVATAAPAAAAAPAQAVAPVKATTPQASIPEPPTVGDSSSDADVAAKKKTLLGG
jgi:hypothetical protein